MTAAASNCQGGPRDEPQALDLAQPLVELAPLTKMRGNRTSAVRLLPFQNRVRREAHVRLSKSRIHGTTGRIVLQREVGPEWRLGVYCWGRVNRRSTTRTSLRLRSAGERSEPSVLTHEVIPMGS